MSLVRPAALIAAIIAVAGSPAAADEPEITGEVSAEARLFPNRPIFPGQRHHAFSLFGEVEYYQEWRESGDSVTVKPFFRLDSADKRRTHFDLREAFWLKVVDDDDLGRFEVRAGLDKVFWGVTESRHLVDIINQTDLIEYPDEEEKLGQPMAQLSVPRDWGTVDLFVLPGFRERTFPGRKGRLRPGAFVDVDNKQFESGAEDRHVDFAARYSHTIDVLDFGLSWFRGTGREPSFIPTVDRLGQPVLIPLYQQIDQGSLDAQVTTGPWLLKLETLYRAGQRDLFGREDGYYAHVAGFEYTFFGIFGTDMDLGVLSEHLFDDRDARALTPFQNDLFMGLRWTANDPEDSTLLFGAIQDLDSSGRFFFVEASRRFSDHMKLTVEASIVAGGEPGELLFDRRKDDYIQLYWTYSF